MLSADDTGWLITLIVVMALLAIVVGARWFWSAEVYPDRAGSGERYEQGNKHLQLVRASIACASPTALSISFSSRLRMPLSRVWEYSTKARWYGWHAGAGSRLI
jgi:hypothetical protein